MTERKNVLEGLRILVVEDEYFLAVDLADELARQGAGVIGPVGTLPQALGRLETESRIDGAILDIDLRGQPTFEIADRLRQRHIPFIFATGFGEGSVPEVHADVPLWQKPFDYERLAASAATVFVRGPGSIVDDEAEMPASRSG